MKTIMKSFFVVVLLLMSAGVSAQVPIELGVKAGANLSNFSKGDWDAKVGFNAGITADINFAPSMYVLTGLEFTMKGGKNDIAGVKLTANPMYLQLPVHFGYKLEVMSGTNIVFRAGPYLAYGIAGKAKAKKGSVEESIDFFGKDANRRFDYGIGGGVGAEFGKIGVTLGYDFGLNKLVDADGAAKNQNAYLSLGYRF